MNADKIKAITYTAVAVWGVLVMLYGFSALSLWILSYSFSFENLTCGALAVWAVWSVPDLIKRFYEEFITTGTDQYSQRSRSRRT